jgi:hypothetical protein
MWIQWLAVGVVLVLTASRLAVYYTDRPREKQGDSPAGHGS